MLTDDMTRVCGEIVAMRKQRSQLLSGLAHENRNRRRFMGALCAAIGDGRAQMAKRTKSERLSFLHTLTHTVHTHLRETRNDLAGARRAWAGKAA